MLIEPNEIVIVIDDNESNSSPIHTVRGVNQIVFVDGMAVSVYTIDLIIRALELAKHVAHGDCGK